MTNNPARRKIGHLIVEYPLYQRQRLCLENKIASKILILNLSIIICGKNERVFLEYCTSIIKQVNIRNKVNEGYDFKII